MNEEPKQEATIVPMEELVQASAVDVGAVTQAPDEQIIPMPEPTAVVTGTLKEFEAEVGPEPVPTLTDTIDDVLARAKEMPCHSGMATNPAFLQKLQALRREVAAAEKQVEDAKGELRAATAYRDKCHSDIIKAIDEEGQQPSLPFTPAAAAVDAEFEVVPSPVASAAPAPEYTPTSVDDESWRDVPLADALAGYVTSKVLEKLTEAELTTMGQLGNYCKHSKLTDIAGVGETKAAKIEEGLDAFWKKRKEKVEGAAEQAPSDQPAVFETTPRPKAP